MVRERKRGGYIVPTLKSQSPLTPNAMCTHEFQWNRQKANILYMTLTQPTAQYYLWRRKNPSVVYVWVFFFCTFLLGRRWRGCHGSYTYGPCQAKEVGQNVRIIFYIGNCVHWVLKINIHLPRQCWRLTREAIDAGEHLKRLGGCAEMEHNNIQNGMRWGGLSIMAHNQRRIYHGEWVHNSWISWNSSRCIMRRPSINVMVHSLLL